MNICDLVLSLLQGTEGKGRHLYTDNFYTSVSLFSQLISKLEPLAP